MDKAERERLEATLSEQLGIKVIVDEYAPPGTAFIFNMNNNESWNEEVKEWVVLPADEGSIQNVSEGAKNAILMNLNEMKDNQERSRLHLESPKFPD